jgi:lysophospholipase L1-like esterase
MIYGSIELHNTVELEPASGGGVHLCRFPKEVRDSLSPLGRMVALESAGCELRFVTEAENLRVAVSSLPSTLAPWELHNQDVFIFKGSFFHSHLRLEPGKINHLNLVDIGGTVKKSFLTLKPGVRDTDYFSHHVWRVLFGRYPAVLHEVDTYGYPVRPPRPDELPKRRILFYGSSITNGASPTLYHLCYVQQAARHLQADALNQGLSGSCLCEPEIARYLAGREDWDVISLELGVNMREGFSVDEFRARSGGLIRQIIARHPAKPVFLTTIFPNGQSPENAIEDSDMQHKQEAFCQILRDTVEELGHPLLHLIEGREVFPDYSGITRDLVHPGDYGHMEMGRNLAQRIAALLGPSQ